MVSALFNRPENKITKNIERIVEKKEEKRRATIFLPFLIEFFLKKNNRLNASLLVFQPIPAQ